MFVITLRLRITQTMSSGELGEEEKVAMVRQLQEVSGSSDEFFLRSVLESSGYDVKVRGAVLCLPHVSHYAGFASLHILPCLSLVLNPLVELCACAFETHMPGLPQYASGEPKGHAATEC